MGQHIINHSDEVGDPIALASFYRRTSSFCSALINLRDDFQGDIDRFLIYLIILLDDVARSGERKARLDVGVSALSIAEITGIPRETVRRKISILLKDGIIRREGYSHYHVNEKEGSIQITDRLSSLLIGMDAERISILPKEQ